MATVARWRDIPQAVVAYLGATNRRFNLKISPHPNLVPISWPAQSQLEPRIGGAAPEDSVGLTRAYAGVAETGTLVMTSAPETPTALNFLPDTQIVALPAVRIFATYEDVWAELRRDRPGAPLAMPRTVNWVTGSSRTGDIDQTLLLGVHGSRRVHILLIDEQA